MDIYNNADKQLASTSKQMMSNESDNPLDDFSGCHEGIIENFRQLQQLVELTGQAEMSSEIRQLANKLLTFFKEVVVEHHAEEEQELFTAVMDSALKGAEADQAKTCIDQLVAEHRQLESMWASIEPDIRRLSRGKVAKLDREQAQQLAQKYLAHAQFEEQFFLPLSARILSKNDLSALGLSLHMRHQDSSVSGYI